MSWPVEAGVEGSVSPGAWLAAALEVCRADLPPSLDAAPRGHTASADSAGPAAGVVGLVGGAVPREAVLAAGLVPVELQPAQLADASGEVAGGLKLSDSAAAVYMAVRTGRLAALDGLIVGRGSESFVKLFHVLRELAARRRMTLPALHFHDQLVVSSPAAAAYNRRRLLELLAVLGSWTGRALGDGELASAIAARNGVAGSVRAVDELRHLDEPAMRGGEVLALAGAARRLPPAQARSLLDAALAERSPFRPAAVVLGRAVTPAPPVGAGAPSRLPPVNATPLRLVLSGSDHDHIALYGELESAGAIVVGEDHGFGTGDWTLDAAEGDDPIAALLERDARLLPRPARSGIAGRVQAVLTTLRCRRGAAVLQLVVGDDEAPGWETPALAAGVAHAGARFASIGLPWPGRTGALGALASLAVASGAGGAS